MPAPGLASHETTGSFSLTVDLFRTRDHVANFDDIVAEYARRSVETRRRVPMKANIAYGDGPGETLDLFFPAGGGEALPVHMFVHGGYWRLFSKEDFSFVADTVTAAGAIAAIVDYSLMPAVRLADIVAQVRRAKRWLVDTIAAHGGDPATLTVSGHSAGAHLATFLFHDDEPDPVRAALLLGGVYDIRPLRLSFLQPLIGLTEDEARLFSPLGHDHHRGTDVTILFGARETEPFHSQAWAFEARLAAAGGRVFLRALAGADHMSAMRDLGQTGSEAGRCLTAMIEKNR